MDKFGLSIVGLGVVCLIAYCSVVDNHADGATRDEQILIAEAYHCGMLDALQEKTKRGRACDTYKAIAKAKGVSVPP